MSSKFSSTSLSIEPGTKVKETININDEQSLLIVTDTSNFLIVKRLLFHSNYYALDTSVGTLYSSQMMTEFTKGLADNGCHFQQEKNVKTGNSYFL